VKKANLIFEPCGLRDRYTDFSCLLNSHPFVYPHPLTLIQPVLLGEVLTQLSKGVKGGSTTIRALELLFSTH